jgi:16S rRNA U516 pseudouridylate synthase RsuA-like enzyme
MRRNAKLKVIANRIPLRKSVTSASAASRRSFPAWIDAGETTVSFTAARSATPRVRDGLVHRRVSKKTSERKVPHGGSR